MPLAMGKVMGGGSSINAMAWAHGHKNDWDLFASEAGDPGWSYESVLNIYRRIEDWHGAPDPKHRGTGGPVFVQPAPDPNPVAPAMVEGARSVGISTFESHNGRMMEGHGGAAILDLRVRDGKRQSVFRSLYLPLLRPRRVSALLLLERREIAAILQQIADTWRGRTELVTTCALPARNDRERVPRSRAGRWPRWELV